MSNRIITLRALEHSIADANSALTTIFKDFPEEFKNYVTQEIQALEKLVNEMGFEKFSIKTSDSAHLSSSSYSKYYDRLTMYREGKIHYEEIYGLEQAREHVKEFYATKDEYSESRNKRSVTIEKELTITTKVEELDVTILNSLTLPK